MTTTSTTPTAGMKFRISGLGEREIGNPSWLNSWAALHSVATNAGAPKRYWQRDQDRLAALDVGQSCQVCYHLHPKHGESHVTVTRIA